MEIATACQKLLITNCILFICSSSVYPGASPPNCSGFIFFIFCIFPSVQIMIRKEKYFVVEQKLQSQQSCERKKLEKNLGSNPGINFLL